MDNKKPTHKTTLSSDNSIIKKAKRIAVGLGIITSVIATSGPIQIQKDNTETAEAKKKNILQKLASNIQDLTKIKKSQAHYDGHVNNTYTGHNSFLQNEPTKGFHFSGKTKSHSSYATHGHHDSY